MKTVIDEKALRHRMVDADISRLSQLSLAAGLSRNAIRFMINKRNFKMSSLDAIAQVLNCRAVDLLTDMNGDEHEA